MHTGCDTSNLQLYNFYKSKSQRVPASDRLTYIHVSRFMLDVALTVIIVSVMTTHVHSAPLLKASVRVKANVQPLLEQSVSHIEDLLHKYEQERLRFDQAEEMMAMLVGDVDHQNFHVENLPHHKDIRVPLDADMETVMASMSTFHAGLKRYEEFIKYIKKSEEQTLSSADSLLTDFDLLLAQMVTKVRYDIEAVLMEFGQLMGDTLNQEDLITDDFRDARDQSTVSQHFADYVVLHRCKLYLQEMGSVINLMAALQS